VGLNLKLNPERGGLVYNNEKTELGICTHTCTYTNSCVICEVRGDWLNKKKYKIAASYVKFVKMAGKL
jgi:hypothetical protein